MTLAAALLCTIVFLTSFSFGGDTKKVTGGGTTIERGEKSTFALNAVENGDGSVNGHLIYHFRGGNNSIEMELDCIEITGNRATLSGAVTSVSGSEVPDFIFVGARASFTVEDNGQGKGASPDMVSDVFFSAGASCAGDYTTYLPISGNIQVKQ